MALLHMCILFILHVKLFPAFAIGIYTVIIASWKLRTRAASWKVHVQCNTSDESNFLLYIHGEHSEFNFGVLIYSNQIKHCSAFCVPWSSWQAPEIS